MENIMILVSAFACMAIGIGIGFYYGWGARGRNDALKDYERCKAQAEKNKREFMDKYLEGYEL